MIRQRIKSGLALLGLAGVLTLSGIWIAKDSKENRLAVAHYQYDGYVEAFAFDRDRNGLIDEIKCLAALKVSYVHRGDPSFTMLMKYFPEYKAEQ